MSSNYPPDWDGSADSGAHEDCLHIDKGEELFRAGAAAMRELLARFVEQGPASDPKVVAESMRANWHPGWGEDPGKVDELPGSWDACL